MTAQKILPTLIVSLLVASSSAIAVHNKVDQILAQPVIAAQPSPYVIFGAAYGGWDVTTAVTEQVKAGTYYWSPNASYPLTYGLDPNYGVQKSLVIVFAKAEGSDMQNANPYMYVSCLDFGNCALANGIAIPDPVTCAAES